jgi:hypothetical protein
VKPLDELSCVVRLAFRLPPKMRRRRGRNCDGLGFREPCFPQEPFELANGRQTAGVQNRLHDLDAGALVRREGHDAVLEKIQLDQRSDAGAALFWFRFHRAIAD